MNVPEQIAIGLCLTNLPTSIGLVSSFCASNRMLVAGRLLSGSISRQTSLPLAKHFPLSGRVWGLHPLEYTHAERIKYQDPDFREFDVIILSSMLLEPLFLLRLWGDWSTLIFCPLLSLISFCLMLLKRGASLLHHQAN